MKRIILTLLLNMSLSTANDIELKVESSEDSPQVIDGETEISQNDTWETIDLAPKRCRSYPQWLKVGGVILMAVGPQVINALLQFYNLSNRFYEGHNQTHKFNITSNTEGMPKGCHDCDVTVIFVPEDDDIIFANKNVGHTCDLNYTQIKDLMRENPKDSLFIDGEGFYTQTVHFGTKNPFFYSIIQCNHIEQGLEALRRSNILSLVLGTSISSIGGALAFGPAIYECCKKWWQMRPKVC